MASSFNMSAPVAEMEQRIASGDAAAASELARYYAFIQHDDKPALHWYQKAAELGGTQERLEYDSYKSALESYRSEVEEFALEE